MAVVVALGACSAGPVAYAAGEPAAATASDHHLQMMRPAEEVGTVPRLHGQDAFGAIQEVVRMLESDPTTDWSKVNLERLRQHLIDMNKVTLEANVEKAVEGGFEATPAHLHEIDVMHLNGWRTEVIDAATGVVVRVTASDPHEVEHPLGFIGVMTSGARHQMHHLAMAQRWRIS